MVDSEDGNSHFVNFADGALDHCYVCMAFDTASHVPFAGTSAVLTFNGRAQAACVVGDRISLQLLRLLDGNAAHLHLPFLGDLISLRAMDMFSNYSLLLPVQPENPQEV